MFDFLLTTPLLLASPQEAKTFAAGLAQVRKQMERRQWDKAYADLRALLDKNAEAEWALAEAAEIREDMRRVAFWRGRAEPDPATLVTGKLEKYKDGKLEISYSGRDLRDWEGEDGYHVFPAIFDGPYSVTIRLRNHPPKEPVYFVAGSDQETPVRVTGGLNEPLGGGNTFYPARMHLIRPGGKEELLDENGNVQVFNILPSRPAEFRLDVAQSKLSLAYDGKKILEGKRPKTGFGTFAFFNVPEEELAGVEILLKGSVQPAWLQIKADAVLQRQREDFEAAYVEREHLPDWLLADGPATASGASGAGAEPPDGGLVRRPKPPPSAPRPYPGPALSGDERDAYAAAIGRLEELSEREGTAAQIAHLDALEKEAALAPVRLAFLRMRVAESAGRAEEALRHADAVLAADAAHLPTRLAQARLLARAGRHAPAEAAYDALLKEQPGQEEAVHEYVNYLIERARIGRAHEVVQAATSANPALRDSMQRLQGILAAADKGPSFARTFEHVSEHYEVRSDLSEEICYEAAQLLEKALTSYSVHLKRAHDPGRTRFRVYIFSGEASYMRYTDEAFGGRMENSAGVYSRLVKQLLIWNLPYRADRLRTTVHEGFHQYLDSVTAEAPVWFNEGLAEYYELAETVDGRFRTGQANADHLRLLRTEGPAPLGEFLATGPAGFYAEETAGRNYAQAWAFVHFLLHSTREYEERFDRLFVRLTEGAAARAAVLEVLGPLELAAVERDFRAHLDRLAADAAK